jgi:flavin reductase (DIM6/NTAB) family NADH-FMN oxidoreductase RutF
VNISSATVPYGVDEFPIAGLTTAPSRFVKPPRVKESPSALECRLHQIVELPSGAKGVAYHVVIGQVVGIYVDDAAVRNGIVETRALVPIARLGGREYSVVRPDTIFAIGRPSVGADGNVVVKDAAE